MWPFKADNNLTRPIIETLLESRYYMTFLKFCIIMRNDSGAVINTRFQRLNVWKT